MWQNFAKSGHTSPVKPTIRLIQCFTQSPYACYTESTSPILINYFNKTWLDYNIISQINERNYYLFPTGPRLLVMGDDSCLKGRGFESWCCIQYNFYNKSMWKNVRMFICLFVKIKNKRKRGRGSPNFWKKSCILKSAPMVCYLKSAQFCNFISTKFSISTNCIFTLIFS